MIIAVPLQSVHPLDNPVVLGKILEPLVQKCKALKKQMDIENSMTQAGTALADTVGKSAVSAKQEPVTEEIAGSAHTAQSEETKTPDYSSVTVATTKPVQEIPKEDSLTTKKFNATVKFTNTLANILFQNVSEEDLARSLTFQRLLTLMRSVESSELRVNFTGSSDEKTAIKPQEKLDQINQLFANSFPFAVFDRRIGGIESKELTATAELLANIRILVRKAVISEENLLDTMSTDDASEDESKNTKSVDAKKSELKTSEQYNDRYMDALQRLHQRFNALEQNKVNYAEYLNKTDISEAITAKQNAINALKEKICSLSAYATPLAFYATIALWEADYYVDSNNPSDKKTNRELMSEHVAVAGSEITDPRLSSISQSVKAIKNNVKAVSLNSSTLSMLDTLKMDLLEQSYINGHITSPQREKLTQALKEGIGNTALYELNDSQEHKSEEFQQVLTGIVLAHPIPDVEFSEEIIKFIGQDEQNMQGYYTSLSIRDSRYSESIKKHTHNTSTRLSLSSKLQHVQAKTEALQTIENEITKIFNTEKDSHATINAQILAANTLFLTLPASISVHQQSLLEESAIFQEYADLTGTEKQLKALRNKINSYRLLNPIASENGTKAGVDSVRTFGIERNDMYIDTLHRLHQRVYALRQEQAKRSPADTKLAQHDSAIGAIGVIENKITALNSLITEIQKLATVTPPTPLNFYVAILLWEKENKVSDLDISKPRKLTASRWGGMFQTPATLSMLDSLKQDLLIQAVANEDMKYSESLVLRNAIGSGAEGEIGVLQSLAISKKEGVENHINDEDNTDIVASSPAVLNSRSSPLLFSFNRTGTESTAPDLSTVDKVKKGWQTTQTTAVALKNASVKAYDLTKERITRPRNADGTVLSDDLASRSRVLIGVIKKFKLISEPEASRTRSRSRSRSHS